jgi:CRISPR-associated protein Csb2
MLALEIELLTGAYRASLPNGSGAEWPPHPERVFSALVQAWGDGGKKPLEQEALEWLERLDHPLIEAARLVAERDAPTVYVPPNDPRDGALATLPDRRPLQARSFRAAVPESPLIRLLWHAAEPHGEIREALNALARRVASVGHSSSLVRCHFSQAECPQGHALEPDPLGSVVVRSMYEGRLAELERGYAREQRPNQGPTQRYRRINTDSGRPIPTVFGAGDEWFVFEDIGDECPDILAFPHVARRVRDALMSLTSQPAPEIITGHGEAGAPSKRPHVAIVPLANVGWRHATGDLLGFAVVLPRACSADERRAVVRALARWVKIEGEQAWAEIRLTEREAWRVEQTPAPSRASLRPSVWCRSARSWATVTPMVLDRFPDDEIEEARIVAAACRNIGVPEPQVIEIHKHSAIYGAPSAYAPRRNRSSPRWSFPAGSSLTNRPRRHVVLRFAEEIDGPVILGAGRFHGMGLCRPLPAGEGE